MDKENPIYKTAVLMEDQEDCDYAKDICLKYELPIWKRSDAFHYTGEETYLFCFAEMDDKEVSFYVDELSDDELEEKELNVISIGEFETLAQELDPLYDDLDAILAKVKELNYTINKPIP